MNFLRKEYENCNSSSTGDDSYSDKWIEYCKKNNIDYKLVNCYDTDYNRTAKRI